MYGRKYEELFCMRRPPWDTKGAVLWPCVACQTFRTREGMLARTNRNGGTLDTPKPSSTRRGGGQGGKEAARTNTPNQDTILRVGKGESLLLKACV